MPQVKDVSTAIQESGTYTEDMEYENNQGSKRKFCTIHTQRPNYANQFSSPSFIPPVMISLSSEPNSFIRMCLAEKHYFIKELGLIAGPITLDVKW